MIKRILNIFRYKQFKLKTMIIESAKTNSLTVTPIEGLTSITLTSFGYIRVGNQVMFNGSITCLPSTIGMIMFTIDCPILSDLNELTIGWGGTVTGAYGDSGTVTAASDNRLLFTISNENDNISELTFSGGYPAQPA